MRATFVFLFEIPFPIYLYLGHDSGASYMSAVWLAEIGRQALV